LSDLQAHTENSSASIPLVCGFLVAKTSIWPLSLYVYPELHIQHYAEAGIEFDQWMGLQCVASFPERLVLTRIWWLQSRVIVSLLLNFLHISIDLCIYQFLALRRKCTCIPARSPLMDARIVQIAYICSPGRIFTIRTSQCVAWHQSANPSPNYPGKSISGI
jgi:hypothetical protein